MTHYLALGAGMQGTAAVYDLIKNCGATSVTWLDANEAQLKAGVERIRRLTHFENLRPHAVDANKKEDLRKFFEKADVCMNCLPYRFALAMTDLALSTNTHYLDLGGNTDIVKSQLARASEHPNGKTLNVFPDCGLAPGMGNLFAAYALKKFQKCHSISVRCGGLPQKPRPPLDYMLVFSVEGLTNEYFGKAHIIRDYKVTSIDTFSELEEIHFQGLPPCEAFTTSGGTSTCPWTFEKSVCNFDYKTVRYKGHFEKFKLLLDLGLLDTHSVDVAGQKVIPRQMIHELLKQKLQFPGDKDLVVLRCIAKDADQRRTLSLEIFEKDDPVTGFTAMERTTAYSATACAHAIVSGKTKVGPYPLESSLDCEWFLEALKKRGIQVSIKESGA